MKKSKKWTSLAICGALVTTILAGCGGNNPGGRVRRDHRGHNPGGGNIRRNRGICRSEAGILVQLGVYGAPGHGDH